MVSQQRIEGVAIERAQPPGAATDERPALVLIHGGNHGSWCWRNHLPYFAAAGWDTIALNWYGHGGSDDLPRERFLARSIADVSEEIGLVAATLPDAPILVAHSMGGLAAMSYAQSGDVSGLVLLTPVVPTEVGGPVIDLPIDPSQPWGPPPFELARELFFQGASEVDARELHALLCGESPRAVQEATHWTVSVDVEGFSCPALAFGAELDRLCPPEIVERLASRYGTEHRFLAGRGHNVLLEPGWRETADQVLGWLDATFPQHPGPTMGTAGAAA